MSSISNKKQWSLFTGASDSDGSVNSDDGSGRSFLGPVAPMLTSLPMRAIIQFRSGSFNPKSIRTLNLDSANILRLSGLEVCISLQELRIRGNKLESLEGLERIPTLQRVDASYNRIVRIQNNMSTLEELVQLDLTGNKIAAASDVEGLVSVPNLKTLYLKHAYNSAEPNNPICKIPQYQNQIKSLLGSLKILDGRILSIPSLSDTPGASDLGNLIPPPAPWTNGDYWNVRDVDAGNAQQISEIRAEEKQILQKQESLIAESDKLLEKFAHLIYVDPVSARRKPAAK